VATPIPSLDDSTPRIRHRKSAEKLDPDQLQALRDGFKAIMGLKDNNGFAYWAGKHGAPNYECEHSSEEQGLDNLFLPWHRAYLYNLELALQAKVPQCTLPWWDWPASRSGGIPTAYAEETVDGESNPLAGFDLPPLLVDPPNWPDSTSRRPGNPERLPEQSLIDEVVDLSNFEDFTEALEVRLHNGIHGWVGGTMQWPSTAAYDPIFWAHHTMVDRIWALWQVKYSSLGPRPELWRLPLAGMNMTVEDVLRTTALGYDYAASTESREL
jgi:tyrosinase